MSSIISSGMGRNSVAMILMLFEQGRIMPVVFADTGAEMPETYEYIEYFNDYLHKHYGQRIIVLSTESRPDLYAKGNRMDIYTYYCKKKAIPVLMNKGCTDKFKLQPIKKWMLQNGVTDSYKGIDAGEAHRAKGFDVKWFPLIEWGINLNGCIDIIKKAGLEVPVKSGCYFCPNQQRKGFRALKRTHLDLFHKSMTMENIMMERRSQEGKSYVTLLPNGPSLSDIERQGDMFTDSTDCDYSEITPCICTL